MRGPAITLGLLTSILAGADDVDGRILKEMTRLGVPGAAIAVVQNGKPVLVKGYGFANQELQTPTSTNSIFQLASVTKQFTAAAILLLEKDEKLRLSDKVDSILAGLPAAWRGVTIQHLLTHTSGIKNFTNVPTFQMTLRKDYRKEEILDLVRSAPLEFAPGEKFAYSNTGYFLLGMIVEKVSGRSYGRFLDERIFRPLAMKDTRVNDLREIIPNRASGYSRGLFGFGLINGEYVSPSQPFSAGALVSSISDMVIWDAALERGQLLTPAVQQRMWTTAKLNNGKQIDYGFGWFVGDRDGRRVRSHGGGINGFSCDLCRFPDQRTTVIVLTNLEGAAAASLRRLLVVHYLGSRSPAKSAAAKER